MTHIANVVELIGSSDKDWSEAAQAALDEVKKTIHGIAGLEVNDITAKVDSCTPLIRSPNLVNIGPAPFTASPRSRKLQLAGLSLGITDTAKSV